MSTPNRRPSSDEKARAEVEERVNADLERGYRGSTNDPNPNSAHSLASGPDSPPLVPDNRTRFEQPSTPAPDSAKTEES
jgi:hypothetical protein